jgi:hypothetical protein
VEENNVRILAIEKEIPSVPAEAFQPLLRAEALRVWQLYQEGVFRELYFRQDVSSAVIVLECDSVEEAEATLNTLPLVKEGLIAFEILPLVPYPGFSRLFTPETQIVR